MQSKGNKIFRQESLDRLSSPERLDQMMQVVNPRAWLPLTTVGSLIVVAGVWSVVGRIPLSVNGMGVLLRPRSVVQLQGPSEGQISKLNIKPGDTIKQGDVIATLDQPLLKQQLQQEQSKLSELLGYNQQTHGLQQQGIVLKRQNLDKQRATLKDNLRTAEAFGPILREKSLRSLAQKRQNLLQNLQQSRSLLPTLKERLEIRRHLQQQGAISQDTVLQTQQQYFDNVTKVSDLEAQLKEADRQQSEAEAEYLKNLNSIKDMKTQLQNLDVQEADLSQQNAEKSFSKTNQIKETKRRIAQLGLELAAKSKMISQYDGRILEVDVVPGQAVGAGSRFGSVETEDPKGKLMSVVYFADKDGKQIKSGMTLQITPSIVKRERYGGIIGKVTRVTPFPVTNQDMSAIIGNDNLANSLAQGVSSAGGAPVQIFGELQEDQNTISGYKWSSSKGPALKISPGTSAQVRVTIGELAPISYVIPIFRSWTGVY